MRFEWDEAKRARTLRERGLDFAVAPRLWMGPMLHWPDTRRDYGEDRVNALGRLGPYVMAVTHTVRGEAIRIISFRRASERKTQRFRAAHPILPPDPVP
jgi:uncharacterized DUF497 family protein